MARQSKAEIEFRARYQHANVRTAHENSALHTVYAGDYICATASTVAKAFAQALEWDKRGFITPDPAEKRGDFDHAIGRSRTGLNAAIDLADQYRSASAAIRIMIDTGYDVDLRRKSRIITYLYEYGHVAWEALGKLDCATFGRAFDASRAKSRSVDVEPFRCESCKRPEDECSANPCAAVIADRE